MLKNTVLQVQKVAIYVYLGTILYLLYSKFCSEKTEM
jgi:hypothetical protein